MAASRAGVRVHSCCHWSRWRCGLRGRPCWTLLPQAGTAEQARELAARLGGLPLALHAAGTYLAGPTSRYRTFAAYRQALEQELRSLLGAAHPNASRPQVARAVVRHTWEVSLDQLAGEGNALARPVLRLLALLAQAPVPLSLITPELLSVVTGHDVTPVALEAAFSRPAPLRSPRPAPLSRQHRPGVGQR